MRKVEFKKWNDFERKWENSFCHKGVFHQWAFAYEEFETGVGNYTVALVELENGEMVEVLPMNIKFIN